MRIVSCFGFRGKSAAPAPHALERESESELCGISTIPQDQRGVSGKAKLTIGEGYKMLSSADNEEHKVLGSSELVERSGWCS